MAFQAFVLALGQGAVMFHGALIRNLTSGQLPIHMLVSEDNGKAQVDKDFLGLKLMATFCLGQV